VSAIAVTEPEAGSDVAGIRTSAVRSGDEWVINGSKIYITNTANADWLCLLAVNDPDAKYGGYSQIIVPTNTPGVRYDLLGKIGLWTQITAVKELNKSCDRTLLAGQDATTLITAAKLFACNAALRVATECLQLHGGYGLMKESMAGRAFVDTRVGTIGGGSDETMLQYLAKQLGF